MAVDQEPADHSAAPDDRLIWPVSCWPAQDRLLWESARSGKGLEGLDNPACTWRPRTLKKNEDGYGRYLSWLNRRGQLVEDAPISERVTPERIAEYVAYLKELFSSVSVATTVGALTAAVRALDPTADWSWLSRRSTRLKLRAKPSREKRHIVQHTLDLYRYGKELMDNPNEGRGEVAAAQRYQSGLIIALLAARPLRIRNFQAITLGHSLRWDGTRYWLTFTAEETKTGTAIDEPIPDDLTPYLEAFLRIWRPVLSRRGAKFGSGGPHQRLWLDRAGKPMIEPTLRDLIKRYTERRFGTALWPHLFRHCLLTSVAIDQPELMKISATLLSHTNHQSGEKHYNQARTVDASRRFSSTMTALRKHFLVQHQTSGEACEDEAD